MKSPSRDETQIDENSLNIAYTIPILDPCTLPGHMRLCSYDLGSS